MRNTAFREIYSNPIFSDDMPPGVLIIQVKSAGFLAGNTANIRVDDQLIEFDNSELRNHDQRGLHIAVINTLTGHVETAQVFDTYKSSEEFDIFVNKEIPRGFIIIAACKDECTTSLSDAAKVWFEKMGSSLIWTLEYRRSFAFVGISGESLCVESISLLDNEEATVIQVVPVNDKISGEYFLKNPPKSEKDNDDSEDDQPEMTEEEMLRQIKEGIMK